MAAIQPYYFSQQAIQRQLGTVLPGAPLLVAICHVLPAAKVMVDCVQLLVELRGKAGAPRRQADRQTDRQTGRQAGRQAGMTDDIGMSRSCIWHLP